MSVPNQNGQVGGSSEAEVWRVQLPTGEVRALTLDALDEAFQAGSIDEATPVLAPGAIAWTRLADAAGLDAPEPGPGAPSVAPMAVSLAPSLPPASFEAQIALAADDDDVAFKPKRGKLFAALGVAGLVLVAGIGVAVTRAVDGAGVEVSATTAVIAPKAAAVAPPPAEDLSPAPVAAKPALSEEQKARLAEADKAREVRDASKRKDRPTTPARRGGGSKKKGAQPFSSGGDKYDPLNGDI